MADAVLRAESDQLSDLLVPHFDSETLHRFTKVCHSSRHWALNHHRNVALQCGGNPKKFVANVPYPNHTSPEGGATLVCTERLVKFRPGGVVIWVDADGYNVYEECSFGSNVDATNCKVDVDLVLNGTDAVVEQLLHLPTLEGFEDMPELKFKITRLSSHYMPPALFCVRVALTLAFFTHTVTAQYVMRTAPFQALSAIPTERTSRVRHQRRANDKAAKLEAQRVAASAAAEAAARAALRARADEDFVLNVFDDAVILLEGL